jgi:hypothetical protein
MYYTIFSSALIGLRIGRLYLSTIVLSAILLFSSSAFSSDADDPGADKSQCVILLHGLARTSHSMDKMEQAMLDAGYVTANIDYPSRLSPTQWAGYWFAISWQKIPFLA